ncbi:MAG: capsular biosynthesis protein [Lachnospiraceae bacterium]|nr:capsular biosynthesis protein [Lachnospiraceae bacterium]
MSRDNMNTGGNEGTAMVSQVQRHAADNVIEIDLKELAIVLISRWVYLLLSGILAAVIAFVLRFFVINPVYESTALLYVLTKSTSITSLADLQTGANLTQDYLIVTKGRPVLEKVIDYLSLPEDYEELEKKVEVNNPTNTRFIEIIVRDEDPVRAKAICDRIAEVASAFIAEKMDQDPPNIVQHGYADGEPVTHGVLFFTAAGFAIGFLIAAALITVSFITNDDIITPEDVENKAGLKVLASLPMGETEEI